MEPVEAFRTNRDPQCRHNLIEGSYGPVPNQGTFTMSFEKIEMLND